MSTRLRISETVLARSPLQCDSVTQFEDHFVAPFLPRDNLMRKPDEASCNTTNAACYGQNRARRALEHGVLANQARFWTCGLLGIRNTPGGTFRKIFGGPFPIQICFADIRGIPHRGVRHRLKGLATAISDTNGGMDL
jgi:hypothetical protein